MSDLHPLSRERHTAQRWRNPDDYRFAAATPLVPISATEVAVAIRSLPLAFVPAGSGWTLCAVLGVTADDNLCVAATGTWSGYLPARLQVHPFSILRTPEGQPLLAVDEGSGFVGVDGDGHPFFDAAGTLSPTVRQAWQILADLAQGEAVLVQAGQTLHAAGLLEPWLLPPVAREASLTGLHRVNEAALNRLDDTAFGALRRAGVIGLAYAQLFSTGHLDTLLQRAEARAAVPVVQQAAPQPLHVMNEDLTLDWDWSRIDPGQGSR